MADDLKGAGGKLAQALMLLSNPVSSANFGVNFVMKRALKKFVLSNPFYSSMDFDNYSSVIDDFLVSNDGQGYRAWFIRSSYNSEGGKASLVKEVMPYA